MAPTDRRVDLVHAGIRRACPLRIMHFGVLVRPLLARYACAVSGVLRLSRSLSDFAGRVENSAVRGQIFDALPAHGGSMGQKAAEIWTAQRDSQTGRARSDRLLGQRMKREAGAHASIRGQGRHCPRNGKSVRRP